ncbi:MAG: YraN family protein [Lachnospiraceae bacterium]|nr:YraN family protein [Lachnospiraceae bacterium]MBR6475988.1 YraN family protein [Lachnospiraceae bacterium]
MNKRQVGFNNEHEAVLFLENSGYKVIETNFYCKAGEIDIIAINEGYLCFIEVKYRVSAANGLPEEAVDYRKAKRITRSALYYMTRHGIPDDHPVRFDVVAILGRDIKVYKNAFDAIM